MDGAEDLRSRFDQLMAWGRDVSSELSRLPTTLAQLREGAANFQLVGQRLAESSAALEELTTLYGKTLGQSVKRSADAAKALQVQIDRMGETTPTPDALSAAAAELQRTFESLAAMNPFWPPGAGDRRKSR
jgi:hypothetical protein